jgi:hypothetical protein
LLRLKKRVEKRPGSASEVARPWSRRRKAVLAAVTSLLELTDTPLRYIEIKAGVEKLLGEPVPASTVKEGDVGCVVVGGGDVCRVDHRAEGSTARLGSGAAVVAGGEDVEGNESVRVDGERQSVRFP